MWFEAINLIEESSAICLVKLSVEKRCAAAAPMAKPERSDIQRQWEVQYSLSEVKTPFQNMLLMESKKLHLQSTHIQPRVQSLRSFSWSLLSFGLKLFDYCCSQCVMMSLLSRFAFSLFQVWGKRCERFQFVVVTAFCTVYHQPLCGHCMKRGPLSNSTSPSA